MVSYFIGNFSTNYFLMIREILMDIVRNANKRKAEVNDLNTSEVSTVTKCSINIQNNH